MIPEAYVPDLNVRLSLYRRVAELADRAELDAFAAELVDRFGPMPQAAENLLDTVAIKQLCRQAGIERLDAGPRGAVVTFRDNQFARVDQLMGWVMKQAGTVKIRPDQKLVYTRSGWEDPVKRMKGATKLGQDTGDARRLNVDEGSGGCPEAGVRARSYACRGNPAGGPLASAAFRDTGFLAGCEVVRLDRRRRLLRAERLSHRHASTDASRAGQHDEPGALLRAAFATHHAGLFHRPGALCASAADTRTRRDRTALALRVVHDEFDLSAGAFSHAWSLCVEEHFYLVFPLVVLLLRNARASTVAWTVAAILLGGMAVRFTLWKAVIAPQVEAEALDGLFSSYLQAIYYPTYCRVDGLVCGVAVAALRVFHAEAWARYGNPRVTLPLGMALVTGAIALAAEPGTLGAARWQPVLSLAGAVAFYPLFSLGSALLPQRPDRRRAEIA